MWRAGCGAKSHVRFGRRLGETGRPQGQYRAPGRPHRVEQSFRLSKTDLRARPLFARTRDVMKPT